MDLSEETGALDLLAGRLAQRFPSLEPQVVRSVVREAGRRFDDARIRGYVPLLVEHEALSVLRSRAVDEGGARAGG